MKATKFPEAELTFRLTKRAQDVQNSDLWVKRIAQCTSLEELCALSDELYGKHQKCMYPRTYEQTTEQALHAIVGHVLNMRIPEQNRLEMLSLLRQQRSNLQWLQHACAHYGL